MRSLSQSVIARSIIVILLFSVLTPILLYDEKIVEEESEKLEQLDLLSVSGRATANHYLTAAGGTGFEYASVMAGFGDGNIVAGEFGNAATFGQTTINPTSPYHASCAQVLSRYCEFFLASVSDTGGWNWVSTGDHTNGYSFVYDVGAGFGGEAVIGGFFSGSVQFGIQTITSQAGDGYLAKTDPFGNFMWAHSHATTGTNNNTSSVDAVELDMNGDIIIAGSFDGNTDFGGTSINAVSPSLYVAKYDGNNGQLIWVISGGSGNTGVLDLHVSMTGEITLAGINQNAVTFGQQLYANVGVADSFILEIDTNGAIITLVGYGVPNEVVLITGITEDMSGNMYYVGGFGGTLQGQGWSLSASQGNRDAFLIMDSASGNGWATSGGSSNNDSFSGVALLSSGEIIVSATISSSFTAGSNTASPTGNTEILIGGLDSTGAWAWLDTSGSAADEVATGISVNMSDIVTVAGGFSGTVTKGTFSVSTSGSYDVFLWAFDPATKQDMDNDGIPDINDNCPSDSNPTQANTDFDSEGDACDSDDDNDGLTDNFPDNCPRGGAYNWTSTQDTANPSASTDWDNDGCRDSDEDLDDDNDLIEDVNDLCPWTGYNPPRPTWVSDQATDVDGDGCRDSDEDLDDDADSIDDVLDDCPTVAGNSTLGEQGCVDQDGDGWSDLFDDCPTQAGNSTLGGKNACLDTDADGWADVDDSFPTEISQWADADGDGFGDNPQGVNADDCPSMSGTSTEDRLGCFDADEDGYSDADTSWNAEDGADVFSNDPTQWSDYDEDGFGDNWANMSWDDRTPSWPGQYHLDATEQDYCPLISGNSTEGGLLGCQDSDGDGWADMIDALPQETTQWVDSDGDGFGENAEGNEPDACPSEFGNSTVDRFGCLDSDGDGRSDPDFDWSQAQGADAVIFVNDPTQWADSDSDTFGDNAEGTKGDNCPDVFGMSETDRSGCPDSDGDYLSDPDADWTVEMGADACPNTYGNSTNDRIGCLDVDGDGWSNPSEGWTIEEGADAYPDDATRWIKEASTGGGSSTASLSTGVIAGGIAVVLIVIGVVAFVMLRRKPEEVQDKSWTAASPMPEMPNMGAQPTQAVAMPNMSAQPTQAVAMPNMGAQPVAQQYVAPVATVPAVVAQPQPVVQPDPARDYYNGLVAQGYPAADALAYTRQYYPTFQA
ncbi:MAG: thrombospondin type 3 repeat-containing protein [Candidatus Poseidoniaceae archaeon]|nr:thrombospondin type 3 repeat-containing protein [Candidatus Poseidoniaceae archaeon]